ncbi:MAG: gluconokinase [Candidatus Eremiobacteraeota bacterium]|nr:gluconokinase [Candidatus Eremiobacteraeota bacterium]
MVYVVMGVSGSGKSTIASLLGAALGLPCYDADKYHSPSNIEKMERGESLSDEDRQPWLEILARNIEAWEKEGGAVMACSALKEWYRQILKGSAGSNVRFIYLKGTREMLQERITSRDNHFFPSSLLDSQLETLEDPNDAITVSINGTPEEICREIVKEIAFIS